MILLKPKFELDDNYWKAIAKCVSNKVAEKKLPNMKDAPGRSIDKIYENQLKKADVFNYAVKDLEMVYWCSKRNQINYDIYLRTYWNGEKNDQFFTEKVDSGQCKAGLTYGIIKQTCCKCGHSCG